MVREELRLLREEVTTVKGGKRRMEERVDRLRGGMISTSLFLNRMVDMSSDSSSSSSSSSLSSPPSTSSSSSSSTSVVDSGLFFQSKATLFETDDRKEAIKGRIREMSNEVKRAAEECNQQSILSSSSSSGSKVVVDRTAELRDEMRLGREEEDLVNKVNQLIGLLQPSIQSTSSSSTPPLSTPPTPSQSSSSPRSSPRSSPSNSSSSKKTKKRSSLSSDQK